MNKSNIRHLVLWCFLLSMVLGPSAGTSLLGQDIHFSQFHNSPLNLSPGKTGVFDGNHRISAGYRSQWRSVPVPWSTFTAAYDKKFISKYCPPNKSFFSGGVLLNYDKASDLSNLTLSNINLTGSYSTYINPRSLITFGAMLGYASRGFDENSLTWDKQWNETDFFFDTNLSSTENFDADRVNFLETGLGLNFRRQSSGRNTIDLGVGWYHLTTPGVGFYDNDDISLPSRLTLSAIGNFELAKKLDIQLQGLAQFQGPHREYIISGLGKLYVKDDCGKKLDIHLGLGYRTTKALFPILAIQYNNIYGSISYDIDLTDFSDGKDARLNALELHFGYIISNPVREFKLCPID